MKQKWERQLTINIDNNWLSTKPIPRLEIKTICEEQH